MRVLFVTFTEYLPFALTQVLNPALEYCAIVVDEPDIAKKMLENVPPLRDKIFPFYELKECVENNYYDFVLMNIPMHFRIQDEIRETLLKNYGVPKNKFIEISFDSNFNFQVERALRYYKEHAAEFEMFATGPSRIRWALIPKLFKRKLFNFGCDGQDLYYDYQIAKFILSDTGGGGSGTLLSVCQIIFFNMICRVLPQEITECRNI